MGAKWGLNPFALIALEFLRLVVIEYMLFIFKTYSTITVSLDYASFLDWSLHTLFALLWKNSKFGCSIIPP